jgi:DNA-binding XRE family transcriptional regulator
MKSSHGGRSQPAESRSQECSQWGPTSGFVGGPQHSGERPGCSGCCNSGPEHLGVNESLIAFHETTKYREKLKLTVVIHRLVGVDLQTNEIHPPRRREKFDIQQRSSADLFWYQISTTI